jgi:small subunit ribosomal protein S6
MTQLYEGMFLLDNQAVRADWAQAKAAVTDALAKHGATVRTARRWDERRLTYPIRGRKRATYLLSYFEQEGTRSQALRRDLEIDERVLRYLILSVDELPEGELEKSQAELESGFSVPPPPTDDEPLEEPRRETEGSDDAGGEAKAAEKDAGGEAKASEKGSGGDDDSGSAREKPSEQAQQPEQAETQSKKVEE